MFTYKKAPYKNFTLGPKFCWAGPVGHGLVELIWVWVVFVLLMVGIVIMVVVDGGGDGGCHVDYGGRFQCVCCCVVG